MSWSSHKLGDYCEVIAGQSPEGKYYNDSGDGLPFYQGKKEFGDRYIGEPQKWTTKITKEAKAGDILMSVRAPVGPINFSTEHICIGRGLAAIRPSEKLDRDFLFYYLLSKQDEIQGSEGAVFASINKSQIEDLSLSYVDLKEQKRIVAILDQAFADIDKARALTEQNLKNARELFESYLQQVFSQRGEGWVETTLGEISEVSSGGTPVKSNKSFWGGNIPWYSSGELNEIFTTDSKAKITQSGLDGSNAKLFPKGSLLIGMYDTAALKMSILDREGAFNQAIAGVKPNSNLDLEFVLHSINFIKPELLKLRRGVRQKNLNQSKIKSIPLWLPPLDEQRQVVERLRTVLKQTDQLTKIYSEKLSNLEELKRAVLQKAFSGELIKGSEEAAA